MTIDPTSKSSIITDTRNIKDEYKNWSEDLIKKDLQTNCFPYAVMMQQIQGDFNFSTVIRSSNAFGANKVYYFGHRKWDRRGTVGTHHYTDVVYLEDMEAVKALKNEYVFVGLEICDRAVDMKTFVWPKNSLIILGEEGPGLSKEVLDLCDHVVYIRQVGSVRSINAGCASTAAMIDYMNKFEV